jgi:hypothetical protein
VRRWLRPWVIVVAAGAAAGTWLGHELLTPKAGVGVSRGAAPISRLPANARNITYYLRPPASYYEFDTDEASFEEWAGTWRLDWERGAGPQFVVVWDHASGRPGEVDIRDGVRYAWSKQDAGWSLTYDRRTGRAYCSGTYR